MDSTVFKDLYSVLELEPSCTQKDIKTRFRKLSLMYHPDKSQSEESIKRYELISLAYSVLIDSNTRREYDQMYYIQKRVSKSHNELKDEYKTKTYSVERSSRPTNEFFEKERHSDLLSSFKERNLNEVMNERENQEKLEVAKQVNINSIITKNEPQAIVPQLLSKYQNIDNIGEMFSKDKEVAHNFIYDVSTESFVDKEDLESEIQEYERDTKLLKNLKPQEFKTNGDLILDKIILQ